MKHLARASLLGSVLAATAVAQLSISVATIGEGIVGSTLGGGFFQVPSGIDVSAGVSRSTPDQRSRFDLTVTNTADLVELILDIEAGFVSFGCGAAYTRAELELVLVSPTPMTVELSGETLLGFDAILALEVVGGTTFSGTTGPVPMVVDSSGVRVRVDLLAQIWRCATHGPAGGRSDGILQLRVIPRSVGIPYGESCGATLESSAGLQTPNREAVRIDGPDTDVLGVLYLGLTDAQVPTPFGCDLLVTPVVAGVPFALDAFGSASFSFVPPGTRFTLQAVTTDFSTVSFSAGLNLDPAVPPTQLPPTIDSVSPTSANPGDMVVISGSDFLPGVTLRVDGNVIPIVSATATAIRFVNPGGLPCDALVEVQNPDLRMDTGVFNTTPTSNGAGSSQGPVAGGTPVAYIGSGFVPGTTVTVGGVPVPVTILTSSVIGFATPPGALGPALVVVTTPSGCSLTRMFTYV